MTDSNAKLNTAEPSENKRALLEKYLRGKAPPSAPGLEKIQSRAAEDPVPLSFGQEQLWFLAQMLPAVPLYNESQTIYIPSALDVDVLEWSLNEFIRRHEIWRTSFPLVDGKPVQKIHPHVPLRLSPVDLRNLPEAERETEALRLATEDALQPFDLASGPLLRARLIRLGDLDHRLYMTEHHIIFDAVAIYQVFLPELYALYEACLSGMPSPLPPLPIQYADYAIWQRQAAQGDAFAEQLAYWRQQLAGAPQVLELPTDRPRPALQTCSGSMLTFELSGDLTAALRALSRQEGVTLYMCMIAAFQTLLYRYTGQEDLLLGTVTAGRKRLEIQKLMGYFLNTLVLRTDMSGNPTFRELLSRVREVNLSALAHEDIPFEHVVRELQPERDLSHHPLIQVLISYQPPLPMLQSGWRTSQMDVQSNTAKFDLTLELDDRPQGLIGRFIYNADLFNETSIMRLQGHWQTLLEEIVAKPSQGLAQLSLLSETERQMLLVTWNAPALLPAEDRCIHQLFEDQVERTPDVVAVVCENDRLTYQELNSQANQLAQRLQKLGVMPEVMVGMCVERSLDGVVGLLGILKAGGVYVPLDPTYPRARLAFMLGDTRLPVLVTQQRLLARLPEHAARVVCIDSDSEILAGESPANPCATVKHENLAYVIYTSGSSGQPRGVLVTHGSLANHCRTVINTYGLHAGDRVLQFSTFTFDAALEQILPTLVRGARLILRGEEIWSSADLQAVAQKFGLTVMNLPTAYWNHLAQALAWQATAPFSHHLRLVIVGGDRIVPAYLRLWMQTPLHTARLLNAYGPTEATITTTIFDIPVQSTHDESFKVIPIGRPIGERTIYILDRYGNPVPPGVPGELYIGGNALARGYLHQPALTSERFMPDPFSPQAGARLYKSGDLARYLPDGNIEFLGRVDQQVKIRGFRVELGEIEEILRQHPAVCETIVSTREGRSLTDKCLVAYVVAAQGQAPSIAELKSHVQELLPEYMLPAEFVLLDALPLLPNGKLDRRTLPAPQLSGSTGEEGYVAPKLLVEHQLVQIWQELLDSRPIGISANFFHLGGHSLLAARLVARMEQAFGRKISLSTLFSGPTIEQLATALQRQEGTHSRAPLLAVQASGSKRPFFFLHGDWTGGAFYCFALARAQDADQPFYVLEPYKFAGLERVPPLESVAASHLESLRAVQPEGPYLLGGFCNGGLLAYEMARQLRAAGQEVDLLLLINPTSPLPVRALRTVARRLARCTRTGADKQAEWFLRVRHALRHVYRFLRPSDRRLEDFGQLVEIDRRLNTMFPPVEALYRDYVGVFTWLAAGYEPGIYDGNITFLWAREELFMKDEWREIVATQAKAEIENYIVPGTHMSCVTEHVLDVAERLRLCLSRSQRAG